MSNLIPPVTATEIAKLAGVTRASVSNWRKRHDDFPKPVGGTGSRPVFDWNAVQAWLSERGQDTDSSPVVALQTLLRSTLTSVQARGLLAGLTHSDNGWQYSGDLDPAITGPVLRAMTRAADAAGTRATLQAVLDHAHEGESSIDHFATPEPVASMMAALLEPLGTQLVRAFDPACGSGSLLIAAAQAGATELFGQEILPTQASLARVTVHAETGTNPTIEVADSLHADAFPGLTADAVLCSPPVGTEWGADRARIDDPRWAYGVPGRTNSDLAWVQHALSHLRPGGFAVLLLPAQAASRASGKTIRAALLRAGVLRAVIGLPTRIPQLLWTRLSLQIWVLRRPDSATAPDNLLLVDIASTGSDSTAEAGTPIDWQGLDTAVRQVWTAFTEERFADAERPTVSTVARVVDLLDDYVDLTPGPHVKLAIDPSVVATAADGSLATLDEAITELTAAARAVGRVRQVADTMWRTATLADLTAGGAVRILRATPSRSSASHTAGRIVALTGRDIATGGPPSGTVHEEPDGDTVIIEVGDILVPTVRGARGQSFRIAGPAEAGVALGSGGYLVRTDPDRFDPWFVAGFLGGLDESIVGTTTDPRSGANRIRIPLLPLDRQQRYGQAFRAVHELRAALAGAGAAVDEVAEIINSGLVAGALEPTTPDPPSRASLGGKQ
ncbi:N-6 DNA methylase [Nocardia thailandica]|uniref:N-6 DNA methylase n=1 Tax=Nocardia thailandica TaxID=257275 RepID=A0ABW6PIH6_9NOCA